MTEANGMTCAELTDVTAELALGVLTGRERADALAHLDRCAACAAHVRQLTTAGEQLIGLLPASEPPTGFEARAMERLGLAVPRHRSPSHRRQSRWSRWGTTHTFGEKRDSGPESGHRGRRMLAAAATAVAVAAAALGGWELHTGTSPPAPPALSSAPLLAGHQKAGEVFVFNREPHWMHVTVHLPQGGRTVICQLESPDGRITTVGSFPLTGGWGSWGSPVWVGDGAPVGVRLVTADGAVLATASFPKAPAS